MGIFPGAKAYFRERSGAFATSRDGEPHPDLYVSDLMLCLYMFDAYREHQRARSGGGFGSLTDLAIFLWNRISQPDTVQVLEHWQTHVVTFDVPGRTPRAKEATQERRRAAVATPSAELIPFPNNANDPLPAPFSAFLRSPGGLRATVAGLIPIFHRLYKQCIRTKGAIVIQCEGGPIYMKREGIEVKRVEMSHLSYMGRIGEGDMSACFWVQYFNSANAMVLSKDTDMLILLGLVCPASPKKLTLRLDYGDKADYIDMCRFRRWAADSFKTYNDAFIYIVLMGNDYLPKCLKGCGAPAALDALAGQADARSAVECVNGLFALNEGVVMNRLARACVRGSRLPEAGRLVRNAWWYFIYSVCACNGSDAGSALCTAMVDDKTCFGWFVGAQGRVETSDELTPAPVFSITSSF